MPEFTSARFPTVPPHGWCRSRIGDAVAPIARPIRMRDDEVYRLVSVRRGHGGLFDRERLPGRKILTKTLERLEPGAFIIARMQIVHGACALVPDDMGNGAVSKSYVQFVGTPGCETRFFARLAQTPEMNNLYLDASHGVVIEKMTFDLNRWLQFELNLPPVAEQQRIVEILDTVDEAIGTTEEIVAKLKQVKQGLLHDLLTRGIDHNGELRDPDRHPEHFKDSPLGRVPRRWEVRQLATCAEVRSGIAKNENRPVRDGINVRYLRVANVQDGYLDLAHLSEIRIERSEIERYRVLPGDVLMNEGGDLDKLGRGSLWRGEYPLCVHQNHVFVVRCAQTILPEFLDAWTGSEPARRYFMVAGKQTTNLASINKTALGRLPVAVPPLDEQRAAVSTMQEHAARLGAEERGLGKLRLLKQGLMDDLLTGRVRVAAFVEGGASR